jgi:type II secretory pathway pseudopilin PulG
LLELGIVLGVIAILMAGSIMLTTGAVSSAKKERASTELRSYANIAASAFMRGVTVNHNMTGDQRYIFDQQSVASTRPICYDLSNSGWGGALPLTNPGNSVASMFVTYDSTTNQITAPNGGKNSFDAPYVLCFYPHHAEVRTCVPRSEMAQGLANSSPCAPCGAGCASSCPAIGGQQYGCIVSSAPALPSRAAKIGLEYGALLEMPDRRYEDP